MLTTLWFDMLTTLSQSKGASRRRRAGEGGKNQGIREKVVKMAFWVWLVICLAFLVCATVLAVNHIQKREQPLGKVLRKWMVDFLDIFSGGG